MKPMLAVCLLASATAMGEDASHDFRRLRAEVALLKRQVSRLQKTLAELQENHHKLRGEIAELTKRLGAPEPAAAPKPSAKAPATTPEPAPPAPAPRTWHERRGRRDAAVSMVDGSQITVCDLRLQEIASGMWIGTAPSRTAAQMYYTVRVRGVTLSRSVPFGEIDRIEFFGRRQAGQRQRQIHSMLLRLKDGGAVTCDMSKGITTVTPAKGKAERYECATAASGVLRSGKEVQGQPYISVGFTGKAIVGREAGAWFAQIGDIRRIDLP